MEKNLHSGHRQRLKARFLSEGLEGFEKHNMLELLLFFSIPQKDTNPVAHRLLNRFGSLNAIFEAPFDVLCSVKGVSEHTATLIKLIPAVWRQAAGEVKSGESYNSLNKIGRMLVKRYAGVTVETPIWVMLDSSYHIIDIVKLGEGTVNMASLDMRKLVEYTIRANAAMTLIAHNHPGGDAIPSSEDLVVTEAVSHAMRSINVNFLEHLLIAGDRYEALMSMGRGAFCQRVNDNSFYDDE